MLNFFKTLSMSSAQQRAVNSLRTCYLVLSKQTSCINVMMTMVLIAVKVLMAMIIIIMLMMKKVLITVKVMMAMINVKIIIMKNNDHNGA